MIIIISSSSTSISLIVLRSCLYLNAQAQTGTSIRQKSEQRGITEYLTGTSAHLRKTSRHHISFLCPVAEDYCSPKQTNEKQRAFNKANRPQQTHRARQVCRGRRSDARLASNHLGLLVRAGSIPKLDGAHIPRAEHPAPARSCGREGGCRGAPTCRPQPWSWPRGAHGAAPLPLWGGRGGGFLTSF